MVCVYNISHFPGLFPNFILMLLCLFFPLKINFRSDTILLFCLFYSSFQRQIFLNEHGKKSLSTLLFFFGIMFTILKILFIKIREKKWYRAHCGCLCAFWWRAVCGLAVIDFHSLVFSFLFYSALSLNTTHTEKRKPTANVLESWMMLRQCFLSSLCCIFSFLNPAKTLFPWEG